MMTCSKEIKCKHNLERQANSLCNKFCTKDTAVACNAIDDKDARKWCTSYEVDTDIEQLFIVKIIGDGSITAGNLEEILGEHFDRVNVSET
jgi:hypothetical protein